MELTPTQISGASFRTVRKGYDPSEVDDLLARAAEALEQAYQQATAMEARARSAVARLQEQAGSDDRATNDTDGAADGDGVPKLSTDDAEHISRTLLLAQHTADRTVAEARDQAERIVGEARAEADATLDSTREMSADMLEEARVEARRLSEDERIAATDEVERLKARRDFLLGDVDQLEAFLVDQRDRLRSAAREIESLAARVPDGLGSVNPPLMSAADDADGDAGDGGEGDGGSNHSTEPESSGQPAGGPSDDDWTDEEARIILPPEAQMPFVDAGQLAQALDASDLLVPDGSGEVVPDDTSELDATQMMEALDLPAPDAGAAEDDDDGDG